MKLFTTLAFFIIPLMGIAQLQDDFSSTSLAEWWQGDRDDYVISDDELQLKADEAGASFLYAEVDDMDSLTIELDLRLDFSPSGSNRIDIVLMSDAVDYLNAQAYIFRIGESGSNDALQFIHINEGEETVLATGAVGAVSSDPVRLRYRIDVFRNEWFIFTDYGAQGFFDIDPEIMVIDSRSWQAMYTGLNCVYTSSRKDKYFFDNIAFRKYEKDITPPAVASHEIIDDKTIAVAFSEVLDKNTAEDESNYTINGSQPTSAILALSPATQVLLNLVEPLDASTENILEIKGVSDIEGNKMSSVTLRLNYARSPAEKDIIINEVLTDPVGSGSDFVEFYNRTEDFLEVTGCEIYNALNDRSVEIEEYIIPPLSYVAFTPDTDYVLNAYGPPAGAVIVNQDLPAFNNDVANFSLRCGDMVIDSFDYYDTWHLNLLDDTEGVTLERISATEMTNLQENWHSAAATVKYGTPGYENSTFYEATTEGMFNLVSSSFSPNQDGEDDFMIIEYDLDQPGYVINTTIYDSEGYEIKRLQNNQNLGSKGLITWDGTDEDDVIADIGIYIVVSKLFHPDGETLYFKKAVALLDYLD